MCGIAGIFQPRGGPPPPAAVLDALTDRLSHRGPDGRGTWSDGPAGIHLGHRRLAIIDLSEGGRQPKASNDGRFTISYNGEIYNYLDLRAQLQTEGRVFHGESDTEVLLEAVGAWGIEQTLDRVVGMFAFGLWDAQEQKLHLARDRFGEKPLHYAWIGDVLVFASELKAIANYPGFDGRLDRAALEQYVRHGYVPAPRTIYQGVAKLPPASLLTISKDDGPGRPSPRAYWSAESAAREGIANRFVQEATALEELDRALRGAVKGAAIADVPLGVFLSGGIDSSLVAALLQAQSERPIHTFTIGFQEAGFDESAGARQVAAHLGTDHTQFIVTHEDAQAAIPLLAAMCDEPFADSSQIPTFLVSRLARAHVTVALSGDGGDEVFGGYNRHVVARWLAPGHPRALVARILGPTLRILPTKAWDALARTASKVPLATTRRMGRVPQFGDKLHKLSRALQAHGQDGYQGLVSLWPRPEAVLRDAQRTVDPRLAGVAQDMPSEAERFMLLDALSYLPDDILAKVDRASMAVGLETRAPLLDTHVFATAWRLPLTMRIRNGRGKWAARQVLARYVPREVVDRPKSGFAIPLAQWLRGPLRAWAEALLEPSRLEREGHFQAAPILEKWHEHQSGKDWSAQLWVILMFQAWLESHPLRAGGIHG